MIKSMSNFVSVLNFIKGIIFVGITAIAIIWSMLSFFNDSISHPLRDLYMIISQSLYSASSDGKVLPHNFGDMSFSDGIAGVINLVIGVWLVTYCTVKIWITVADKIFSNLERKLIVAKFGQKKYDIYCKLHNQKLKELYSKSAESSDLEKAQFAHYEKWKIHYKSSLSYSEWREKVLSNGEK